MLNVSLGKRRHFLDTQTPKNDSAITGIIGSVERLGRLALLLSASSMPDNTQKLVSQFEVPDNPSPEASYKGQVEANTIQQRHSSDLEEIPEVSGLGDLEMDNKASDIEIASWW